MMASESPTVTLIHTAFTPQSTLYTILECKPSSTSAELKRAYRQAALRYHPDRQQQQQKNGDGKGVGGVGGNGGGGVSSTLKFQAVSAAYQILMDDKRRSAYDSTGRILEEEDESYYYAGNRNEMGGGKARAQPPQKQWEQFFQSIFNEIISTGANHATNASAYRGSGEERTDVLYYYKMCKGDMNKVVQCIIHGSTDDVERWEGDIIAPAIERGEVDDYKSNLNTKKNDGINANKKQRRRILEDSSSDEEIIVKEKSTTKRRKLGKRKSNIDPSLVDTDDDEDEQPSIQRQSSTTTSTSSSQDKYPGSSMSKRDKMDYRVAKKLKAKAKKEMDFANIISSKNWDVGTASTAAAKASQSKKSKNMGGISDDFLANIERKYGDEKKKKKRNRI